MPGWCSEPTKHINDEKALNCSEAIDGLHETLASLYEDNFNNTKEDFESQISNLEHQYAEYESKLSDFGNVTPKVFDNLRKTQSQTISKLEEELAALNNSFAEAMEKGDIKEGSESWYSMRDSINAVSESLIEARENLAQLYVDEFENTEKGFENQLAQLEHQYAEYESKLNDFDKSNPKVYGNLRDIQSQTISELENELSALNTSFANVMASGRIKEGSQSWYEMRDSINAVSESLIEARENLAQLYVDEFDAVEQDFDNQLSSLEHQYSEYESRLSEFQHVTSKNYSDLQELQSQTISKLEEELVALNRAYINAIASGKIKEGSQAWYDMRSQIESVEEAISSAHETLANLYFDEFERVQTDFEHKIDHMEQIAARYQTGIDELEARGYFESKGYYEELKNITSQNIEYMQNEVAELTRALSEGIESGEIQVYSDAWYDMQSAITDTKNAIAEANVELLNYDKTMRQIDWDRFDYVQEQISKITQESDFLIDLMSNDNLYQDNGRLSDEGLATLGLRAQNYNVYMAQADKYADEILSIEKEMAKDPYNKELIERRDEMLKLQQESIIAAENEKNAIADLVKDGIQVQLDNMKELIDVYKENLNSAKDLYEYQRKIEEQSENIASLRKQLSAYEGDTSEEARAKIQQIKVDLADAEADLAETEYDKFVSDTEKLLDELYLEYETMINERLDDLDMLIENVIATVNENAFTLADNMTGNTLSISETLDRVTSEVGYTMSEKMQSIWDSSGHLENVVAMYGDNFDSELTLVNTTLNAIETNTANMVLASERLAAEVVTATQEAERAAKAAAEAQAQAQEAQRRADEAAKAQAEEARRRVEEEARAKAQAQATPAAPVQQSAPATSTPPATTTTPSKSNSTPAKSTTTTTTKTLTDKDYYGVALAIWNGNYGWGRGDERRNKLKAKGFDASRVQRIIDEMGVEGAVHSVAWIKKYYGISDLSPYHYNKYLHGGLIDYTGIAQVDGSPTRPEMVLNAADTRNFIQLKNLLKDIDISPRLWTQPFGSNMFSAEQNGRLGDVTYNFDIDIDHVEDYNDFVTKLQHDDKFESMVQDMTTNRLSGGSSLAKLKYKWKNE